MISKKYKLIIINIENNIAGIKCIFNFNNKGNTRKKTSEGRTSQKTFKDNPAILLEFFVSA
ncbi:MAG: hypothetical protein WCK67_00680 [bacterium]